MHVVARAPGKLLLSGEYAVLFGAPAVVAAVDRFAEAQVRLDRVSGGMTVTSRAEHERWTVSSPEREELTGGDLGAVLAALRVAEAWAPGLTARQIEVEVDSRSFLTDGRKLGIGRSAATVTAATAAFLAVGGIRGHAEICEAAVAAHALFQEGHGSGADVAAAAHGGVIEFRRTAGRLTVEARALPPGLHLVVGWTGESVPTDPLLKRFASAAASREPRALSELCAIAERAAGTIAAGDAARFCEAADASADLLAQLGEELGLPIVTPALERLIEAARQAGAAAKPSGAGGGDCGIAFAASEAEAARVRAAWSDVGIVPLPLTIAPSGAHSRIEPGPHDEVSLG
jgi:phosphomevalonate kinase